MCYGNRIMHKTIDSYGLLNAWDALKSSDQVDGWISIRVSQKYPIRAGNFLPNIFPSLLIGTYSDSKPSYSECKRIKIDILQDAIDPACKNWIAISLTDIKYIDIFAVISNDISQFVAENFYRHLDPDYSQTIINRVLMWKTLLEDSHDKPLSKDEITGLYGELLLLKRLIDAIEATNSIKLWCGPYKALHDFQSDLCHIEVKSSISSNELIAKIGSLDQLDYLLSPRLFLIAFRLETNEDGISLPSLIDELSAIFIKSGDILEFLHKLKAVGYNISHNEFYLQKFIEAEIIPFEINSTFPRITKEVVDSRITSAKYSINISQISSNRVSLNTIISNLGCTHGIV